MIELRLKAVQFVSFRYSDVTTFDAFKQHPLYQGDLRRGEVYVFFSLGGDQVLFVLGEHVIDGRRCLDTRRVRMDGKHRWDIDNLHDFADAVGIRLIGAKELALNMSNRMQEIKRIIEMRKRERAKKLKRAA